MQKILLVCFCLFTTALLHAHVGSPNVVMQGAAGPYPLLVSIKPPEVIPGIAYVTVYAQKAPASITARAVYFRTGTAGAPEPDEMKPVTGKPGQYVAEIWMMNGGSSSIQVQVKGPGGQGKMIVPVLAIATQKKDLPAATGYGLAAAGLFLFVLLITIVSASVSDAVTKRGDVVSARRKKIRFRTAGIASFIIIVALLGGYSWVAGFADNYSKLLYQPTKATVSVVNKNGVNELRLALDTSDESQRKTLFPYLVPDHGKLMHLFVMRMPAMDAFAHLHPERTGTAGFRTLLPALPKGEYVLFADIVYVSGFTETIKATFSITNSSTDSTPPLDRDDAYAFALRSDVVDNPQLVNPADNIICGKPGTGVKLKDSSTMVWEGMTNEPLEANQLYTLTFSVLTPDKKPAQLEPYLGMSGHAAIVRNDGNVYMHLHPMGTASMAAETNFMNRIDNVKGEYRYPDPQVFQDSIDGYTKWLAALSDSIKEKVLQQQMEQPVMATSMMPGMEHTNRVEFPYSFPAPGQYRIWVQVKRNGQVLTAAFDKIVE